MQTSKWGPPTWKAVHAIAHNYNPDIHDPEDYRVFFEKLGKVLPCKYCRYSYQEFFEEIPIDDYLGCQRDMAKWMYLMHNKVNDKLRKQGLLEKPNPRFDTIWNRYEQWRADCASKRGKPNTCRMPEMTDRCSAKTKKGRQCSRKQAGGGCRTCQQHRQCKRRSRQRSKRRSRRRSRRK